jgi:hypothetical protein
MASLWSLRPAGGTAGEWLINICHGPEFKILGSVWTSATDDPRAATNAALGWLRDECARLGLKIAGIKDHNDQYGPDERPYFTTSQVCIVDKDWT